MKRSHIAVLGASAFALAATALTPTTTASATPDDTARTTDEGRIVATADGPGYLVSMLPDGTDRQRIAELPTPNRVVFGIDVTDDGSQVAMSLMPGNRGHIYTVNSDGSDFQQVSSGGHDTWPTFSPNGSRIAFDRTLDYVHGLMRMKSDGSALTSLTTGAEPRPRFLAWSPDGEYIAFSASMGRQQAAIVLTNPQGTWFRYVKTLQTRRGALSTLDWSPDSSQIIYSRYSPDLDNADLWTVTKDGNTVTRITDTPNLIETTCSYSPDGLRIACRLSPPKRAWLDVLVMDADGGNRNRIRTDADETIVAWGGTP